MPVLARDGKESLKHSFSRPYPGAEKRGGGEGARNRPLIPHTFSGAMKPLCLICSTRHESWQGHVFVNTKPVAVNTEVVPVNTGRSVNACVNADRHSPGYMREYMKVYRAVRAGKAEWVR